MLMRKNREQKNYFPSSSFCNFSSYVRKISHSKTLHKCWRASRWPRDASQCYSNRVLSRFNGARRPSHGWWSRGSAWRMTVWCPSQPPQATLLNGQSCMRYVFFFLMNSDLWGINASLVENVERDELCVFLIQFNCSVKLNEISPFDLIKYLSS